MKPLLIALAFLLMTGGNVYAGGIILDNSQGKDSCCVSFEAWQWGAAETLKLCALPGATAKFSTVMRSIGKIKVYRMPPNARKFAMVPPVTPDKRYTPSGMYTPFSSYTVTTTQFDIAIRKH